MPAVSNEDEIFGFLAGKGQIVGDIENTIPVTDWNLFVARRKQKHLLDLMTKLEWDMEFDYKSERSRR